jgi:hypothetical protein
MDLVTLRQQHLAQAEQRVALGERHIADQGRLIDEIDQNGRVAAEAKRTLAIFEKLQAVHIAHCDRLLRELETSRAPSKPHNPHYDKFFQVIGKTRC